MDATYRSHRIVAGKPALEGLPATYVENQAEADTLEITLQDDLTGVQIVLSYTVFSALDAIIRSARFLNAGPQNLRLLRCLSMSIDFVDHDFDVLYLPGSWARERSVERCPLKQGTFSVESRRGTSSHQQNPFFALLDRSTTEYHGEVYGFSLVYSGNFLAQVEVDQYKMKRASMGIHPFDFCWLLRPSEAFQCPEVVMVYSDQGLGQMSRSYHRLYRSRLCRGRHRDLERPILINTWEAVYFNVNDKMVIELSREAKDLGLELIVIDDGWFGRRDNDTSSLGDWYVNEQKFPSGLSLLAKEVEKNGLKFGLWIEPEMVSPDSDLYRAHPDWCLHVPNRSHSMGRQQLVLDFSREDVCAEVVKRVSSILSASSISYIKWDMNRHLTEVGSARLPPERQRETAHRYVLGLYRVLEEITSAFPDILFESCSGGGGRFDPGMLYYMPQTWTSDNTDAIDRVKIQYGTSIVYPPCAMGAHVSAIPNHLIRRISSMKTRGDAAMSGILGYELDLRVLSAEEKQEIREQVEFYKKLRHLILNGDFYRLLSPFEGNDAAWMFVSVDRKEAYVSYFRTLARANQPNPRLLLRGLDSLHRYRIDENGRIFGGDELMYVGLKVPELRGDFQSATWVLRSLES
jgi:alpha-galactosidase